MFRAPCGVIDVTAGLLYTGIDTALTRPKPRAGWLRMCQHYAIRLWMQIGAIMEHLPAASSGCPVIDPANESLNLKYWQTLRHDPSVVNSDQRYPFELD